ncbi:MULTISPECIES: hypothetical protein [unclassified Streptomyces]|uniref:hypothetical protein n=1 Tax=unclassified Streptomyces TaxID=2593676 RepID=UPI0027D9DC01|nr:MULTISPECIES: hypothetical protein [unclassified Streptomyces]
MDPAPAVRAAARLEGAGLGVRVIRGDVLWASVEAAHGWWRESGRPGPERFGLTIAPDGTHTPWLDTADNPVPVRG